MTKTILFVFFLLSVLQTLNLNAEDFEQEWNDLRSLTQGKKIFVHLKSGGDITGKFVRVDPARLFMLRKKEEIRLKKEHISLITTSKSFSRKNLLIGAAIGFAAGTAFGTYMESAFDEGYGDRNDHIRTGVQFGLLGSAAGIALAGSRRGEELILYSSPKNTEVRTSSINE